MRWIHRGMGPGASAAASAAGSRRRRRRRKCSRTSSFPPSPVLEACNRHHAALARPRSGQGPWNWWAGRAPCGASGRQRAAPPHLSGACGPAARLSLLPSSPTPQGRPLPSRRPQLSCCSARPSNARPLPSPSPAQSSPPAAPGALPESPQAQPRPPLHPRPLSDRLLLHDEALPRPPGRSAGGPGRLCRRPGLLADRT